MKRSATVNAFVSDDNQYTILRDDQMNVDPIVKERLNAMVMILDSLELDPSMWDEKNPIWQNTNNHVMYMLRKYYHAHEKDDELHKVLGSLIDHFVWMYVSFPEIRARIGWITWFMVVYVTDHQFREEAGVGLLPEPWNDPRNWALAEELARNNPVTTTLEKIE